MAKEERRSGGGHASEGGWFSLQPLRSRWDRSRPRRDRFEARLATLIDAIRTGDSRRVEQSVISISRVHRWLAPLALAVGAFAMLFDGLKLLVLNWRLAVIEALPAMWLWFAMLDLRLHLFRGKDLRTLEGGALAASVAVIALITAAAFFLNGVFAFALAGPGVPLVRPAFARARATAGTLLGWGLLEGVALGFATMVTGRWGRGWFSLTTGIVIAVIMFSYLAIPSRLLGLAEIDHRYPLRDRAVAGIIGGIVGSMVCTPPYLVGRLGVIMLGSKVLLVPAVIVLVIGFGLQAGAAGSVRAIRMSYKLTGGRHPDAAIQPTGATEQARRDGDAPLDDGARAGEGRPVGDLIRHEGRHRDPSPSGGPSPGTGTGSRLRH